MRLTPTALLVLVIFGGLMLVSALEATHAFIGHHFGYVPRRTFTTASGDLLGWQDLFVRQLASWWLFGAMALGVIWFTRRHPVEPDRLARTVLPHIILSLAFPLTFVLLSTLVRYHVFISAEATMPFQQVLLNRLALYYATFLLYYWAIVGVCSAFRYYALYRERAISQARLDRELSESRMRALQAQLKPHMLFNTLNAISGYAVQRDHAAVVRMVTRLSEVLRHVLRHHPARSISLGEELDTVQSYLDLQAMRLGPRLSVGYEIDSQTLSAQVPPLLVQPIVENAVHHGIGSLSAAGRIAVKVRENDGHVVIEVSDNGPGFGGGNGVGTGIGMSATRQRLHLFYGGAARMDVVSPVDGGACVRIVIPRLHSADTRPGGPRPSHPVPRLGSDGSR